MPAWSLIKNYQSSIFMINLHSPEAMIADWLIFQQEHHNTSNQATRLKQCRWRSNMPYGLILNMFSGLQVPKMSLNHFLRKQNLIFSHLLWVSSVLFIQCSILINNYSKVIMCGPIMKKNMIIIFWLQFHLIIFPKVLLTGSYIDVSLRSHYPNQWWPSSMRHIYIIQFNEL